MSESERPGRQSLAPPAPRRLLAPGLRAALQTLEHDCEGCRACGLGEQRQRVVVGRGNAAAPLLLIGEAPGAQEDRSGLPFVGRAGQLLDQLLTAAGLNPEQDTYICNAIKCRPPDNRRPTAQELAACRPLLQRQIALVDAPVILLLGATALEAVLGIRGGITRLRGQWRRCEEPGLKGRWLMPLLHPSYLLRYGSWQQGSPRWLTLEDLTAARRLLQGEEAVEANGEQPMTRPL